jgi:hypothetical protein
MRSHSFGEPAGEGVFGPELLLNAASGAGCLRLEDGELVGELPDAPSTNAFLVWIGRPVIVVSEGVRALDLPVVAGRLRSLVGLGPSVPVVASLGRLPDGSGTRAVGDNPDACPDRELARAETYVQMQCGWDESERMTVELNGRPFVLTTRLRRDPGGRYTPLVE